MTSQNNVSSGVGVLFRFVLKRAFTSVYGLMYIIIGTALPLVMLVLLITSLGSLPSGSGVSGTLMHYVAAFVPLFSSIGVIGVTYMFSTDRSNGLYEYLIATRRVRVKDIFIGYSMVVVVVVTIIMGIALAVSTLLVNFEESAYLTPFLEMMAVFSIPVAYFSSLIATIAMLTWTSLSTTFPGVNAPGGIGSILGIIPPLAYMFVGPLISGLNPYVLGGIFSAGVFGVFAVLLVVVIRGISNETMLT